MTANFLRKACLLIGLLIPCVLDVYADGPIEVHAVEQGRQLTGQQWLLHDPANQLSLHDAVAAWHSGQFAPLLSAGSTGLQPGAFWGWFQLHNPLSHTQVIHLEYIDHQLINLDAWLRVPGDEFRPVAQLSMERPFAHRVIAHNRFVIPVELPPQTVSEVLVRFGSGEGGYVYPSMRVWTPQELTARFQQEISLISFLFGGFFLMGVFALVAGSVSRQNYFYLYAVYAFSKITAWATILGYSHQFLLRDNFHWSLMSTTSAVAILLGLLFARLFLQTRLFTPRLDKIFLLMILNAGMLLLAALLQIKPLALVSITLAMLLYPVVIIAAFVRWRQGAPEAGVFSLAWSVLVLGLVLQALRDLGLVPHTPLTYYWPPVASFTEMLTIMFAMGLQVRRLLHDKEAAEQRHREYLENARDRLEEQVQLRTQELEKAKWKAEQEARTDSLTGILNRRSFMREASLRLKLAARQGEDCCLLMFDLDHFKRINDTFGHGVGDEVLCRFAGTVGHVIRETDVFGRIGGEEFALLVGEPEESAIALAERLLIDIAEICIPMDEAGSSITSSIGLAVSNGEDHIESLIQRADKAMYTAKSLGRNRMVKATG